AGAARRAGPALRRGRRDPERPGRDGEVAPPPGAAGPGPPARRGTPGAGRRVEGTDPGRPRAGLARGGSDRAWRRAHDARRTRERCEARVNHPEELLAAFADGTASLEERAEVEAHLAFCEDCLREVELARSAHAALRALPEVEAPPTDLRALDFAGGWL